MQSSPTTNLQKVENWELYPNPAFEFITLNKISQLNSLISKVYLINSSGKILEEFETLESKIIINTDKYEPGFYFVKIEDENGVSVKKVFIGK